MELLSSHYDTISQYYLNKWNKKSFADLDEDKFASLCLSIYETMNSGMTTFDGAQKDYATSRDLIEWITVLRFCEIDMLEDCKEDKQKLTALINRYRSMMKNELQEKYKDKINNNV